MQEFIDAYREMKVTPHVAQNTAGQRSAVPDAIVSSEGHAISQQKRKRIEQGFGWAKLIGCVRQVIVRGLKRVDQLFALNMTALALRFRFENAREAAAKKAREQKRGELASAIEAFQFRDLRAKAGTDKEESAGMAVAKDQLGHADEKMTRRYVRHRKGKLVTPTR